MRKILFLSLLLFSCCVYSQDNLYLVDTITGTSTANPLRKAQGIGDMNGDGYADFILCYPNNVDLYYGNPQFKLRPAHSFPLSHFYSPEYDHSFLRGSAYPIGDVNRDGYADLMIIDYDTTYFPAHPYCKIILGGKVLDTIPEFTFYPPYKWDMFMSDQIYLVGDLNGDGYNDFIINSPYNWGDARGSLFVFRGGKTISNMPWKTYTDTASDAVGYGGKTIGLGDYNGDGCDDFLVMGYNAITMDRLDLYLGNKNSLSDTPAEIIDTSIIKNIHEIKPAGNLNGDGKRDFIITANNKALVYLNNLHDPIIYDLNKFGTAGMAIGTGGDINNDGYDDFFVGNTGFCGSNLPDTNKVNYLIEGNYNIAGAPDYMDIPGDINGDGYADIFMIQALYPYLNDFNKITGKLSIYSYKKIDAVNENKNTVPNDFILNQNYPNPFNPSTVISYQIPEASKVTLKVYDILGKEIKTLVNEIESMGSHSVTFNVSQLSLSSGVYLLRMDAESQNSNKSFNRVIKLMYLK